MNVKRALALSMRCLRSLRFGARKTERALQDDVEPTLLR